MGKSQIELVDPITFAEMYKREGLPSNTILREDDVTWDLWMQTTSLTANQHGKLYPAKIINMGDSVRVEVNARHIGSIAPKALGRAAEALAAYGGKQAPCYIVGRDRTAHINNVYVVKPRRLRP